MKAASIVRRPIGLRARLTITYIALFGLLLLGIGWLFRETLRQILQRDAEAILEEEFAAAKSYLRLEQGQPKWVFDADDPDESRVVQNLQQVLLFADAGNRVLQVSDDYGGLDINPGDLRSAVMKSKSPQDLLKRNGNGTLYLIRSGLHHGNMLLSVGRSLEANERVVAQFTKTYVTGVPLLILAVMGLGWFMAGRALTPLNTVSQAARSVSGSNLSLRLNRRGANDELDLLIDAFNAMVDRLESSFTQIRQFSVDASHELRTPLTSVRGQLEVALFTAKTPEQYRESIMTAIEDVDQLSQVVKALLHLSQAESGQVTLARAPVDLGQLVEKVIEQFQLPAEAESIRLECRTDPGVVIGDRTQLQRMISNLLSNALKFTPAGGSVKVEVAASEDTVKLVVADTGCGIAPEHMPHIFERFYRVPDAGRVPERGLGLGLSFVDWIARSHHARVEVDSRVKEGTRFTVTFRAAAAEDAATARGPVS